MSGPVWVTRSAPQKLVTLELYDKPSDLTLFSVLKLKPPTLTPDQIIDIGRYWNTVERPSLIAFTLLLGKIIEYTHIKILENNHINGQMNLLQSE